jgi:RNA polymerase sigma factor (sigma-70 family)
MTQERYGATLRHVQTLFSVGTVGGLTDGELLEWYKNRTGEAAELAFAVLVERHGPMVLRVCREVLGDEHEAHDAFQATFLVLVRRADSLWTRHTLAPWLHEVARRVAGCARSAMARRRRHERRAAEMAAPSASEQGPDDFGPVLHEEVERLPERYRAAIVLCCLEGQTQAEAARHLGWRIGTVQSRLARGRERLRHRLIRRGIAPTAIVAALGAHTRAQAAAIPPALADSTIRGATQLATGSGSVAMSAYFSASVVALTKGLLRTMFLTKLKIAALAVLSTCILASSVGILVGQETATRPDAARPPGATRPDGTVIPAQASGVAAPEEEPEGALKKRLVDAARRRLEAQKAFYEEGRITIDRFLSASHELMLAEIQASTNREGRITAAKEHLDRVKGVEAREQSELRVGRGTKADVTEAEQSRLQAELDLRAAEDPNGRYEMEVLQDRVKAVERKLDQVLKALESLKKSP